MIEYEERDQAEKTVEVEKPEFEKKKKTRDHQKQFFF